MTATASQLPLHLNPSEFYHLDNFLFSQQEIASAIDSFCQNKDIEFLYLWGEEAVGKTHLLLAMAEALQAANKRVVYLPLTELVTTTSAEILQDLEQLDLLCIDELEALANLPDWQEALFHCFNRLQQTGCKLCVASRENPQMLSLQLADLRSRLATGLIYQLEVLDDNDKALAMARQAQSRGLELPNEVTQYLLRHYSRNMKGLVSLLGDLDKASMAAKRRLTIPFVKQIISR